MDEDRVPCYHCGKWDEIDNMKLVADWPFCSKCFKELEKRENTKNG